MITNPESRTRVDEVAEGIYRISTPVTILPGGFTFNQYLVLDEQPLLFHTGPRSLFPLVSEAVAAVMPLDKLRYLGLSHFEADECGALNEFLAVAPDAVPVCSQVAAMVAVDDVATRKARPLADAEVLELGRHRVRWIDAPHVPHGWECGYLFEEATRTLLCGDLFTQGGATHTPITESDILGPSEAMRAAMDYFAHGPNTGPTLRRLAALAPETLACMHGSAWKGNGKELLTALAETLVGTPVAAVS